MNRLLPLLAFLAVTSTAAADRVHHEIDLDGDRIDRSVQIKLGCDTSCPETWELTWKLPENTENVQAYNQGEEIDARREKHRVKLESVPDGEEDSELFTLNYTHRIKPEEIHRGLYQHRFNLRSLENAETTASITAENLLTARTSYSSEASIAGEQLNISGRGPLNARIKYGDGNTTRHYEFFGENPGNVSIAFEASKGMTGAEITGNRIPVAVLPGQKFNRTVSNWSSGEYVGGSAKMREGLTQSFIPVLTHETVHALNDRVLSWDRTRGSIIEEGTASFIESLVHTRLYNQERIERPPAELFGSKRRYDPDPGDNRYKVVYPRGDTEKLWNYYQKNRSFMQTWNPFDSRPQNREFGYAYSELVVRHHIASTNQSLRGLYRELDPGREITDPQEKWQFLSEKIDLRPCEHSDREKFKACVEKARNHSYSFRTGETRENRSTLNLEKITRANRSTQERPETVEKLVEAVEGLLKWLERF